MHRRLPVILALGLVLVLTVVVFAACGGDEEDPPAAAATSAPASTQAPVATAAPKQVATSAPSGGGGAGGGAVFAAMCSEWRNVQAQTTSFSGPPTGATMPAAGDLRTAMESLDRNLKTFVDQAPAEVRTDFQVLADFWQQYAGIMARANYDFTRLAQDPEFQRLAAAGADPALQQATTNIQNWVQRNCT